MSIRWKNFLVNSRRVYNSIFEQRKIEDIIKDYYENKWISKAEVEKLLEHEKKELMAVALEYKKQYDELLSGFNLNAMRNYELLESKFQGKLRKQNLEIPKKH